MVFEPAAVDFVSGEMLLGVVFVVAAAAFLIANCA